MRNITNINFEERYIAFRKKENRIYSDEEVSKLPLISKNHVHYNEWLLRKESAKRLMKYFTGKKTPLTMLEIGCGNGWLSNMLAGNANCEVVGMDINNTELAQAQRVFKHTPNLKFVHGEIQDNDSLNQCFDIVLFAASIQYFKSLKSVINIVLEKLNINGEIHIVDSYFYDKEKLSKASIRTKNYYECLGFPEMADYYFHHDIEELKFFKPDFLYQPSPVKRLLGSKNPFPWICIRPRS